MNRVQVLLLAFPLFLFCSDLVTLFSTRPPVKPTISMPPPTHYKPTTQPLHRPIDFSASQNTPLEGHAYGTIAEIKFCTSCSYKGNAVTMKKMLEASFPGINVILSNYPPALPKRMLSKVVPVVQFGTIGMVMGGEHIFSTLGIPPPQWYHSLRANRFGTMAVTWLIGNFAQSFLQSTGAFEVYCNGDLVFSKLKEHRFPSEFELRQAIASKIPGTKLGNDVDTIWALKH